MKIGHDRVVGEPQAIESGQQPADIPVDVLAHRQRTTDVSDVLFLGSPHPRPLRVAMVHQQGLLAEHLPPPIGNLHR